MSDFKSETRDEAIARIMREDNCNELQAQTYLTIEAGGDTRVIDDPNADTRPPWLRKETDAA